MMQEGFRQGKLALWLTFTVTMLFMFKEDRSTLSLWVQEVLTAISVWATGSYLMSAYNSACYSVIGVFIVLLMILLIIWTVRQICDSRKCCARRVVRCD